MSAGTGAATGEQGTMSRRTKPAWLPAAGVILLAALLAACAGVTPAGGGGNPAGSWGWETRGPPGFISSSFGGRDMN